MQVRGIDLALRESGAGPPDFLWGHGLLCSMAQEDAAGILDWDLIGNAAHVVRYDARGHGRSEATLDPADYRWPQLARDLLALADALGAERPVLGGLSMGCATTLQAAASAPEHVAGLILVAPPTAWQTRPRQSRIYRLLARAVELFGLAPLRGAAQLSSLAPAPPHLSLLQRTLADSLRRANRHAVVAALKGAAASDLPAPEKLRRIEAPARVLAWSGDPAHPLSTAKRLLELLPNAELSVASSLDDLRAWSSEIAHFLAELSPRRSAAQR